jgi:hypothetical protein
MATQLEIDPRRVEVSEKYFPESPLSVAREHIESALGRTAGRELVPVGEFRDLLLDLHTMVIDAAVLAPQSTAELTGTL